MAIRIVSVTRILNEDDVVEAFVRHNVQHLDHMVFVDNGSSDRTLEILQALKAEGVPLSVFQERTASFNESEAATWLHGVASQIFQAGWVAHLDADEFIAAEPADGLRARLAGQNGRAIAMKLIHYGQTATDDMAELNVPLRMRWRLRGDTGISKVFVRGSTEQGIVIGAGNHEAWCQGQKLDAPLLPGLSLAHYPRRDGWQNLRKITIGWLKALAAGNAATGAGHASHYSSPFHTLRDTPGYLINEPRYLSQDLDKADGEEAPLRYLGGPLKYTTPSSEALKALQLSLRYAEELALQHGRIMNESPEANRLVRSWAAKREHLF